MTNKPQKFIARLEEKVVFNEKYINFHFELEKPHRIDFQAGQFIALKVNDEGLKRMYSICSRPSIKHGIELLVDITPGGPGTTYLANLEFGDRVEFMAPYGHFIIKVETLKPKIFVGTGCGIAPLRSMIVHALQDKQVKAPMTLYWGLRYAKNMFWQDEFLELAKNFKNFEFKPILSKPPQGWNLSKGHVTDLVKVTDLSEDTQVYMCGSKAMVSDMKVLLKNKGIAEDQIQSESY